MHKLEIVRQLIDTPRLKPQIESIAAFAPTNIALCKYWGKRDTELNLPFNSSLSISLADKGAQTTVSYSKTAHDQIIVNGNLIDQNSSFAERIVNFLNFFRSRENIHFRVATQINLPIAAGLASSACGFAALALALTNFFNLQLDLRSVSILARLGSGSACRSLWHGFVAWQVGKADDGMDSYGQPLQERWEDLRIGLLILSAEEKSVSSRQAMQLAVASSPYYKSWVSKAEQDFKHLKAAIEDRNFTRLGTLAEANALAMHATSQTAWPPTYFALPTTLAAMNKVWELRKSGLEVYFTQDAGPNLKLLFLNRDAGKIKQHFPDVEIVAPFDQKFF